jgi:hypothetical protein
MGDLPVDNRAFGLLFRLGEQEGLVEPCEQLRQHVESLPFTAEEIDLCLGLLVDADGRTLGGTLDVEQLDGSQVGQLVLEGMIEMSESGWKLSPRGQLFSDLLETYARATFTKI